MALRYVIFVALEIFTVGTIALLNANWVLGVRRQTIPDVWTGVAVIRDDRY